MKSLIEGLNDFYAAPKRGRKRKVTLMTQTDRPHFSVALAVHPDQVEEATQDAINKGVPTYFDKKGRPLMRSRKHQQQYLRKYGFINLDGGYGD